MRKSAIMLLLAILILSCKGVSESDYQTAISERDALADELMNIQIKYDTLEREKMNIELLSVSLNEENALLKKKLVAQEQKITSLIASSMAKPVEKEISQPYIVRHGDTLWSIAKRFEVPVATLQKLNNIHGSNIAVGQRILLD